MKLNEVMSTLRDLKNPSRLKTLLKSGASSETFGVPLGELRRLATSIGTNHMLALDLWDTYNTDARLLACMLFDASKFTPFEVDELLDDLSFDQLIDDFIFRSIVFAPNVDDIYEQLSHATEDGKMRASWCIIVHHLTDKKYTNPTYLNKIIDKIESEIETSRPLTQWMMNRAYAVIGYTYPEYTQRVLKNGEKFKIYKDYMVSKGCTSPYVVDWVNAILRKKK